MKKKGIFFKVCKKIMAGITLISPKLNSILIYIYKIHEIPNLKNPKNFNEKLTKLKLTYKNNMLVSKCADKYGVREYVESKGLGNILNELYFVWDTPEEIDFDKLPNKFALKCTHGCGYNIICNDKSQLDIIDARKKLKKWLKEKAGLASSELHYLNIKPQIICEKNLCDENGLMPIDYKIYCFDGEPKCIRVVSERETGYKFNYLDTNWNELDYGIEKYQAKGPAKRPDNLKDLLDCARKLSEGFKFVRVDLYDNNNKIILGELTFTPSACCANYYTEKGNMELGSFIK